VLWKQWKYLVTGNGGKYHPFSMEPLWYTQRKLVLFFIIVTWVNDGTVHGLKMYFLLAWKVRIGGIEKKPSPYTLSNNWTLNTRNNQPKNRTRIPFVYVSTFLFHYTEKGTGWNGWKINWFRIHKHFSKTHSSQYDPIIIINSASHLSMRIFFAYIKWFSFFIPSIRRYYYIRFPFIIAFDLYTYI
jgi:hypothetical protein